MAGQDKLNLEVTGGYTSYLLSDVIANSKEGNIWITLQTHQNIIAVAKLKELSGIIIVNNREPDEDTLQKAKEENVPLLGRKEIAFEVSGKFYEKPLGDMGQTIIALVIGNPEIDIVYVHKKNGHKYSLDTRKIKAQLKEAPLNSPAGIRMIKEDLKKDTK